MRVCILLVRTSESLCAASRRSTSFSRLRLLNSSLNPFSRSSLIFSVSLSVRGCVMCGNGDGQRREGTGRRGKS